MTYTLTIRITNIETEEAAMALSKSLVAEALHDKFSDEDVHVTLRDEDGPQHEHLKGQDDA